MLIHTICSLLYRFLTPLPFLRHHHHSEVRDLTFFAKPTRIKHETCKDNPTRFCITIQSCLDLQIQCKSTGNSFSPMLAARRH